MLEDACAASRRIRVELRAVALSDAIKARVEVGQVRVAQCRGCSGSERVRRDRRGVRRRTGSDTRDIAMKILIVLIDRRPASPVHERAAHPKAEAMRAATGDERAVEVL